MRKKINFNKSIHNFDKFFNKINSNIRYQIYSIVLKYTSKVHPNDHQIQSNHFNLILNDFFKRYFDLTLQAKNNFKAVLYNFSNLNSKDLEEFFWKIMFDKNFKEIYFKNANFYRNFPENRQIFIEYYKKILSQNIDNFYDNDNSSFKQNIFSNEILNTFLQNYRKFISDMYCENAIESISQHILSSIKDIVSIESLNELRHLMRNCYDKDHLTLKMQRANKVIIDAFKFFESN